MRIKLINKKNISIIFFLTILKKLDLSSIIINNKFIIKFKK